jgi:hypothetical protein
VAERIVQSFVHRTDKTKILYLRQFCAISNDTTSTILYVSVG